MNLIFLGVIVGSGELYCLVLGGEQYNSTGLGRHGDCFELERLRNQLFNTTN